MLIYNKRNTSCIFVNFNWFKGTGTQSSRCQKNPICIWRGPHLTKAFVLFLYLFSSSYEPMKQIYLLPSPQPQWGASKGSGEPSDASVNWTHLYFFPPSGCWGRESCGRWSNGTAVGCSGASIQSCSGGKGDWVGRGSVLRQQPKSSNRRQRHLILMCKPTTVLKHSNLYWNPSKSVKFLPGSSVVWAVSYFIWSVTCTDFYPLWKMQRCSQ